MANKESNVMTRKFFLAMALATALSSSAEKTGAITPEMLDCFKASYQDNASNRAIHNALNATGVNKIAFNEKVRNNFDVHFSHCRYNGKFPKDIYNSRIEELIIYYTL